AAPLRRAHLAPGSTGRPGRPRFERQPQLAPRSTGPSGVGAGASTAGAPQVEGHGPGTAHGTAPHSGAPGRAADAWGVTLSIRAYAWAARRTALRARPPARSVAWWEVARATVRATWTVARARAEPRSPSSMALTRGAT